MIFVFLVASCPLSSEGADEGEANITRADCDEFVHRIFNKVRKSSFVVLSSSE